MSSFIKKIWKNRTSQFPNKRRLSVTEQSGSEMVVYVSREEGTVSEQGDAFSAANMNDLESRIEQAFENTGGGNFVGVRYHASLAQFPDYPCWEDMTAEEKLRYDESTGAGVLFLDDEIPDDIIGDTDISAIDDGTLTGIAADHDERLTDAETDIATLNSALNKVIIGEEITISGTTNSSGQVSSTKTQNYSGNIYVLTNVSGTLSTPYSVTFDNSSGNTITFRIRKMSDNSAVANTTVNFSVLIVGRKPS